MTAHLRYAKYVARHKWFVLAAGRRTGAPLWRLITHDWSKLSRAEWGPYVARFYGPNGDTPDVKIAFKAAFERHWTVNPHHWEHWASTSPVPLPMPDAYVREMVADWMGAGRAITGKWEVAEWYEANRDRIVLHPSTRLRAETLIERVS